MSGKNIPLPEPLEVRKQKRQGSARVFSDPYEPLIMHQHTARCQNPPDPPSGASVLHYVKAVMDTRNIAPADLPRGHYSTGELKLVAEENIRRLALADTRFFAGPTVDLVSSPGCRMMGENPVKLRPGYDEIVVYGRPSEGLDARGSASEKKLNRATPSASSVYDTADGCCFLKGGDVKEKMAARERIVKSTRISREKIEQEQEANEWALRELAIHEKAAADERAVYARVVAKDKVRSERAAAERAAYYEHIAAIEGRKLCRDEPYKNTAETERVTRAQLGLGKETRDANGKLDEHVFGYSRPTEKLQQIRLCHKRPTMEREFIKPPATDRRGMLIDPRQPRVILPSDSEQEELYMISLGNGKKNPEIIAREIDSDDFPIVKKGEKRVTKKK